MFQARYGRLGGSGSEFQWSEVELDGLRPKVCIDGKVGCGKLVLRSPGGGGG